MKGIKLCLLGISICLAGIALSANTIWGIIGAGIGLLFSIVGVIQKDS